MENATDSPQPPDRRISYSFRRSVLRGLTIVLPPLLTIVIFLWVGSTVQVYVLKPVKDGAREVLVWWVSDIRSAPDGSNNGEHVSIDRQQYARMTDRYYIPEYVLEYVEDQLPGPTPAQARWTSGEAYRLYVEQRFLQDHIVIPVFLLCFVLLLYLLGKSLAAGFGSFFWNVFERGILQLPLIRTVYRAVKQVTNFMFSQGEINFNRVVAVEYPRDRMWTIGLVTGEGLRSISASTSDETVSVMLPCSPMPVTGYVVVVPTRKTIPLDITIDQALQFIVSCGVVSPRRANGDSTAKITVASNPGDKSI